MRAYISHGLKQDEMYWISILADELRKKDFEIVIPNYYDEKSNSGKLGAILSSHLYLGILTDSRESQRLFWEFKNANTKIPSLLVIDSKLYGRILTNPAFILPQSVMKNIIQLDRNNYNKTIDMLNSKIQTVKEDYTAKNNLALLVGGAAFLVLLSILSKNK